MADQRARPFRWLRRQWRRLVERVSWTPPTSTDIGQVAKAALAAGLSWWVSLVLTDVPDPVLGPLAALVTVQVSVRASVTSAIQRSFGVVVGVLLAIAIGDAVGLNAVTVGLLTGVSLAAAQLVLRMPSSAATQVPISVLLVMAAIASREDGYAFERAFVTAIGACVGVIVSLGLPASRLTDARQTIGRLGDTLGGLLETMATGLLEPWGPDLTADWRRRARTARERLVNETEEAVGSGREAAQWNLRDRRHIDQLGRFEDTLPRLERTAIGVSVISRGLDDHARLVEPGTLHRPMPDMSVLLAALGVAVRMVARQVLGECDDAEVNRALDEVRAKRVPVARAAFRQARRALDQAAAEGTLTPRSLPAVPAGSATTDAAAAAAAAAARHAALQPDEHQEEGEWLSYAALLVQVDRIVGDLSAPLPP